MTTHPPTPPPRPATCLSPPGAGASPSFIPAAEYVARWRERMGDIGEPVRHIEYEPFPIEAPAEPAIAPQPETTPKEPVPA